MPDQHGHRAGDLALVVPPQYGPPGPFRLLSPPLDGLEKAALRMGADKQFVGFYVVICYFFDHASPVIMMIYRRWVNWKVDKFYDIRCDTEKQFGSRTLPWRILETPRQGRGDWMLRPGSESGTDCAPDWENSRNQAVWFDGFPGQTPNLGEKLRIPTKSYKDINTL